MAVLPSRLIRATIGSVRKSDCGATLFPRTDPAVIIAVTFENQILLGRQADWPKGMLSVLAGFVEPGETPEHAAAREVFEEAGVLTKKHRISILTTLAIPSFVNAWVYK